MNQHPVTGHSLEIDFLNNFAGDKRKRVDTSTTAGRQQAAELMTKLLKVGTAVFLERADKTYRVTGYDPKTDRLLVRTMKRGEYKQLRETPPEMGERLEALERKVFGKQTTVRAKYGGHKGRVAAVAPTAGG